MGTIGNAKNTPLNVQTGTIPNVGGAMLDWFQPMVFTRVLKTTTGFQVIETALPISFRGVIQPLSGRKLMLKPEGQRAWNWQWLHADPSLSLDVDEVVNYLGVQTRIMSRKDYQIYGYVEYEIVQDWEGAGPTPIPTCPDGADIDGGNATTTQWEGYFDGGGASTTNYDCIIDGGGA